MKIILFVMVFTGFIGHSQEQRTISLEWHQLPSVPDPEGFAGSYGGVSKGALIVAGGANFPNGQRPWTGGVKTWYSDVFVLEGSGGEWKKLGQLPHKMGYGISLTYGDAILCVGGADALRHFNEVFLLGYSKGELFTTFLSPLPIPLANAAGVLVGDVLYVMGGTKKPNGLAENIFLSLDLASPVSSWKILEPFPGQTRMLATAGSYGGKVFFFGGVHLYQDSLSGTVKRKYLKDCWVYKEGMWQQVGELPHPLAAAASPALLFNNSSFIVIGGDDGSLASEVGVLKDKHPGFRSDVILYDIVSAKWSKIGSFPTSMAGGVTRSDAADRVYAPVTAPLVNWEGRAIIVGGEVRPGVRTNKVWAVKFINE